jgi:hypothetical protein
VVDPLSFVATFVFVGCGALLSLAATSAWGRRTAPLVAVFPVLAPAATLLSVLIVSNLVFFGPRLGASLYNYKPALQPLLALIIECVLFTLVFHIVCIWDDYAKSHHQLKEVVSS